MTVEAPAVYTAVIEGWHPRHKVNGPHLHWATANANKRGDGYDAWLNAKGNGWAFIPGKVRLTITLVYPRRYRVDADNLYGRAKGAIDGLKGHFFEDDSTDVLDLVVRAEVRPGVKQTEMRLEAA